MFKLETISLSFLKSLLTLLLSLSSCSNDHDNDDEKLNTSDNYKSYTDFKIASVKLKCVLYFHHNRCFKKYNALNILPYRISKNMSNRKQ